MMVDNFIREVFSSQRDAIIELKKDEVLNESGINNNQAILRYVDSLSKERRKINSERNIMKNVGCLGFHACLPSIAIVSTDDE
mmetsp:Transcript_9536/g.14038  ORF Transcript_9536/g.14038 Transcript_9536/m.14038 type:complete len:83 (+) Transcript_9536:105-353(+)|eukprot:CAMPEP_0197237594 /NCGR_PEP_ID=MMETSP1429-20130617/4389_1 /TAXON_ID=49237 /ORGANISM="Chaetoceros  sp., Strain UNC1202" /LENGTH=82 /DNA_ID=CAMNT_0042696621 /DNA_START=94 /DNA_END=342 /DNA_ORIENTATION=+